MESARAICAAGTLRRASRSVARLYDARLARAGLTTTQFSILRALERHGAAVALTELATELVFERTSLYRALAPLSRAGLVAFSAGRGRAKAVALTEGGHECITRALPCWQEAQDEFLAQFGEAAWGRVVAELGQIIETARAIRVGE